jgi:trans-aconitate methyltransferase
MATKLTSTSQIQAWSPKLYEENARFVSHLADDAVKMLDPRRGEAILDLGCGDGYLTETIATFGAKMVGVDYSETLVAAARQRGIDARLGNGEDLPFDKEFDAAFSNAAMHWMLKAEDTAAGVFRALKPGGRFVGEFAGAGNAGIIRRAIHAALARRGIDPDMVDPWYLPEEADYRRVLHKAGFVIAYLKLFERPVKIIYPLSKWIQTFGSPYIKALKTADEQQFLEEISEQAAGELLGSDGQWTVDYTRIRFLAVRPLEDAS